MHEQNVHAFMKNIQENLQKIKYNNYNRKYVKLNKTRTKYLL